MDGAVIPVSRVRPDELPCLLQRLDVLVALQENLNVFVSRQVVIVCQYQHVLQQDFSVIENIELHADLRQEPHRLDVVAVRLQKTANDLFRQKNVAICEQSRRGHHRRRQACEFRHVSRGHLRLGVSPGRSEQDLQGIPTRGKRRVDVHGGEKRLDGATGIVCCNEAVAPLLKQATEARMKLLEARQCIERLRDLAETALAHGDEIQHVTIFGQHRDQPIAGLQRFGELPGLDQALNSGHLGLDRRGDGGARSV